MNHFEESTGRRTQWTCPTPQQLKLPAESTDCSAVAVAHLSGHHLVHVGVAPSMDATGPFDTVCRRTAPWSRSSLFSHKPLKPGRRDSHGIQCWDAEVRIPSLPRTHHSRTSSYVSVQCSNSRTGRVRHGLAFLCVQTVVCPMFLGPTARWLGKEFVVWSSSD